MDKCNFYDIYYKKYTNLLNIVKLSQDFV